MTTISREVLDALNDQGLEVLAGKGGFFIKGEGFISLAQARKRTGVATKKREVRQRVTAYGDYAIIAAINGRLNG